MQEDLSEDQTVMGHKDLFKKGEIDRKEFDTLEFLKKEYPSLYKAREKMIRNKIKFRKKAQKLIRKGKPVPNPKK